MKVFLFVIGILMSQAALADVFEDLKQCSLTCTPGCSQLTTELQAALDNTNSNCNSPSPIDQETYKKVYEYAYATEGMDLTKVAAIDFADWFMGLRKASTLVETLKSTYAFAFSAEGADLIKVQAVELTKQILSQLNPQKSLDCFKPAYNFAYSESGLNLGKEAAVANAKKQCRIQ